MGEQVALVVVVVLSVGFPVEPCAFLAVEGSVGALHAQG